MLMLVLVKRLRTLNRVMKYGMDMNVQVMEFKMENKDGLWVHFYCNNDMNARHAMPAAHARNENRCMRHGWISYSTVRVKKMVRTRTSIFMNSVCINVGTYVYEYVYV